MKIVISKEAANWYKEELELENQNTIRFFVRYGGMGGRIPGFSLGVTIDTPNSVHAQTTVEELTFFVSEEDAWYFENENLVVHLDEQLEEPQFNYE